MNLREGFIAHHRLFGPLGVLLVVKSRLLNKRYAITVANECLPHPVHLRLRTSDVCVFEEVILNSEYDHVASMAPRSIVDAGANVGLTSVYFANRFPDAKIIAIEPEPANFEVLCRNAACYPNIVAVQAALWREDTQLSLIDPGNGAWGFQTSEASAAEGEQLPVEAVTIDSVMKRFGLDRIDVLKIDIEGAEKEVFESSATWIDRVGTIMVETHDRYKPGCTAAVEEATRAFATRTGRGETLVFGRADMPLSDRENDTPAAVTADASSRPPLRRGERSRIIGISS
jgi:FkbM family methyltransferase